MAETGERFERAVGIMARLRAPGGCPWDREQTFDSIKPYTVEETYEVLEAIDNRDWQELPGELGDLLLQVLFYAEMAREGGLFSIDDVLERLSSKLVSRHPHVFGDVEARTSGQVLRNWEKLKEEERSRKNAVTGDPVPANSLLDGVSAAMPALVEARKLGSRAAGVGFDWPEIDGILDKLHEEAEELREVFKQSPVPVPQPKSSHAGPPQIPEELRARIEDEIGDLFFTVVNLARQLSVDPESALRRSNRKFRRRFQQMEEALREQGRALPGATLEEMEQLWQAAKRNHSGQQGGQP
ncbi:MAG: nucleoside triphosphate pyrophosphohydrolase [Candidatus Korobacteraceae bacterium]